MKAYLYKFSNKNYLLSILCIVTFFIYSPIRAQVPSTQGRDFWFAFMQAASTPEEICVILSAERACTGTISNPSTGWSTNFTLTNNGRVDVVIPQAQGYVTTESGISYMGLHIVATDTISAYSMNYRYGSFDGANLLPTHALLDEYLIQTYNPNLNGSSILIVATENNTTVDITPTAATTGGNPAGSTFSVTLNQGNCYQLVTTSANGDFSGSRVIARDCKKIVVFAGHKCTNVPISCTYCDHIYEPMLPTAYWGTKFAVTTSRDRSRDRVRVTAYNNNTTVSKNGSVVSTLNAGGTYEFELLSTEGSCFIETSGPAITYLYLVGQSCAGTNGDPAMVIINPIEQRIKRITFGTYEYSDVINHYVNIVTPTSNVNSLRLDGTNIGPQFMPLNGNNTFSFARLPIAHATHTLESDSGFIAHVYGLLNVTSYAYSVGSNAINFTNQVFVNDVNTANIPDNQQYCFNMPIDFNIDVGYNYNFITWYFGDDSTAIGDVVTHNYLQPGRYNVMVVIDRVVNNCMNAMQDTLYTIVNIPPPDPIPISATICPGGSYDFNGTILTAPGVYLDTLSTDSECDSVLELTLSVVPGSPIPIQVVLCPGESYLFNGITLTTPGVYRDTIATSAGCDSIVELTISYATPPTVSLGHDLTLCSDSEFPVILSPGGNYAGYQWNTGETTSSIQVNSPGTYSVLVYNNSGCQGDAEVTITLQSNIDVEIMNQTEELCETGSGLLTAVTNAPNILWNTGETTETIEIHHFGRYSVRAYDGKCDATAIIEIPTCPLDIYLPNCITPTFMDGMNDVFCMTTTKIIDEFEIFIYNRWGEIVYHSTDPHFSWDGTVNGKIANNNVFTYKIIIKPVYELKKHMYSGSIFVI